VVLARFRHEATGDAALDGAHALYEVRLRYDVLGLASAGSPWAMHAIGSTLAVGVEAYAAVRGFPRRMAGEDFHLLAKLAKIGRVVRAGGEPIRLRSRSSDRVPFGTGAAVAR